MVGIQSTVGKRAKRMPDTTVKTTSKLALEPDFYKIRWLLDIFF